MKGYRNLARSIAQVYWRTVTPIAEVFGEQYVDLECTDWKVIQAKLLKIAPLRCCQELDELKTLWRSGGGRREVFVRILGQSKVDEIEHVLSTITC